ncbi:MAG: potassium-transporting ATPase subunit C, partial [Clostridia bacterium]|nr:potassium-transporting ATPase subunit C [Clostridia bacterium]
MNKAIKIVKPAFMLFVMMSLLCGILYTGLVTGLANLVFPKQSNGSIITVTLKDGTKKEIGSELIAQEFTKPEYLIGRPLGTTNLSPTGKKEEELIKECIFWWHTFDPANK